MATRKLSDVVRADLLRGVRLEKVLGRFGAPLVKSESSDVKKNIEYSMSEPVDKLNDFLSHDWGTGRWRKYLSLLVIYNLKFAVRACLLCFLGLFVLSDSSVGLIPKLPMVCPANFTVAGEILVIDDIKPYFLLLVFLCWCFFIFGQSIRSCIYPCRRRMVFLDKMCIHQTDESLKAEGILSLAGFLRVTDRLVILWSPQYFTRLWCVFEVAAWLRLKGADRSSMIFMPVSYGTGLVAFHLWGIFFDSAFVIWCFVFKLRGVFTLLVSTTGVVLLHYLRWLSNDLRTMPCQMIKFSLQSTDCFCCSCQHVHPVTNAKVPCDRELIQSALSEWFGKQQEKHPKEFMDSLPCQLPRISKNSTSRSSNSSSGSLQATGTTSITAEGVGVFEDHVRTTVKHAMKVNYSFLQIGYQDALFGCAGMLLWNCSQCLGLPAAPWKVKACWVIEKLCIGFCVWPCVMQTATMTAFCLPPRRHLACDLLMSMGSLFPPIIIGYALRSPLWQLRELADPTPLILLVVAEVLITVALFNKHRPWRKWITSAFNCIRGQKCGDASVYKEQPALNNPTAIEEKAEHGFPKITHCPADTSVDMPQRPTGEQVTGEQEWQHVSTGSTRAAIVVSL